MVVDPCCQERRHPILFRDRALHAPKRLPPYRVPEQYLVQNEPKISPALVRLRASAPSSPLSPPHVAPTTHGFSAARMRSVAHHLAVMGNAPPRDTSGRLMQPTILLFSKTSTRAACCCHPLRCGARPHRADDGIAVFTATTPLRRAGLRSTCGVLLRTQTRSTEPLTPRHPSFHAYTRRQRISGQV
jgi:hypothetical protein